MLELTILSFRVRFTIATNRLLFFLKRIPGLKKVFSPNIYRDYALKDALAVLGVISIASKRIFLHFLYMVIIVILGAFVNQVHLNGGFAELFASSSLFGGMTAAGVVNYALYSWFIISIVFSPACSESAEYNNTKNDDIMLNYMHANPNLYAKSRILFDRIAHILLVTPYLIVAYLITGIPLWGVLTTLILLSAFRLAGEVVELSMFKRLPVHFGRPWLNNVMSAVLLAAAVIIPVYISISDMAVILANPVIALVSIPIGYFSWMYIRGYKLYRKLQAEKINWFIEQLNKYAAYKSTGSAGSGMNFIDAKNWSKDVKTGDLESEKDKHKNKKGFAYLNAIFFDRHSKYFKKKIFQRCSIFFLVLIAVIIVSLFTTIISGEPILKLLDMQGTDLNQLFLLSPVFFFIIYIISMGRITTASVFSNCDIHMLHYRYYRTRETILASFKARLKMIIRYNFLITTVMSFSLVAALGVIFGYMDFLYAGVFFTLLTAIGVLFAFNDLFLYYVIQPYDSAGKGKSIIYTIINYAIYFIAWINFYARLDFFTYSLIIGIGTIIYIGVGAILLLKLAPKRFKLR